MVVPECPSTSATAVVPVCRNANPKNQVQSVAKAFAVLGCFAPDKPCLSASEVAARAGLDRGTAFRLVQTLVGLGYLCVLPGERRYRLTLKCLELGYTALAAGALPDHADALLRDVVPDIADAASLGTLDAGEVVYLARVENDGFGRPGLSRRPGARIGAYATALGQAMLAWLPREEQVAHLEAVPRVRLSERTLTDLDILLARLLTVREQGFAVSDGENAYGLVTVAAPILDTQGRPCAGISLTAAGERIDAARFSASAAPAARRLAATLGDAVRLSLGAIRVRQPIR